MRRPEPALAFVARTREPPALEIRVNFGVFAGREVTPAEIDELAAQLLPDVGEVSIVAEERHEISDQVEVSLHQVRVEIATSRIPEDELAAAELTGRLLAIVERWASACIAERHAEVSEI
jgi:hypothetical protein